MTILPRVSARGAQHEGAIMSYNPHAGAEGDLSADPYIVTRGKPPREYQFKPGKSGNPRGRPPGTKDFRTLLQRELDRAVNASVNGRVTKVSKREAIAMRLVEKALKGDHKAIEACLKYGEDPASSDVALPPMDTDPRKEIELLEAFMARGTGGGDERPS
jgi:hypothetical protein